MSNIDLEKSEDSFLASNLNINDTMSSQIRKIQNIISTFISPSASRTLSTLICSVASYIASFISLLTSIISTILSEQVVWMFQVQCYLREKCILLSNALHCSDQSQAVKVMIKTSTKVDSSDHPIDYTKNEKHFNRICDFVFLCEQYIQ